MSGVAPVLPHEGPGLAAPAPAGGGDLFAQLLAAVTQASPEGEQAPADAPSPALAAGVMTLPFAAGTDADGEDGSAPAVEPDTEIPEQGSAKNPVDLDGEQKPQAAAAILGNAPQLPVSETMTGTVKIASGDGSAASPEAAKESAAPPSVPAGPGHVAPVETGAQAAGSALAAEEFAPASGEGARPAPAMPAVPAAVPSTDVETAESVTQTVLPSRTVPASSTPAPAVPPTEPAISLPHASPARAAAPSIEPMQTPAASAAPEGATPAPALSDGHDSRFARGEGTPQFQGRPESTAAKTAEPASSPAQPFEASLPRPPANPAPLLQAMPEPVRALASLNPAGAQPMPAESNPVPLNGPALAVEIVSRLRDGARRFDIRLDPPELGRVDVRLEVDRNGQATTRLTVDRPETLDLLQREARGLERALQSAGLKTEDGGLEFSLRYQEHENAPERRPGHAEPRRDPSVAEDEPANAGIERYRLAVQARGGVDIRI